MMTEEKMPGTVVGMEKGFGDSAVDGLLAGVGAGLVMALVMASGGLLWGETVADLFRRFAPEGGTSAAAGFLAHVAVSAIYGLLFALLWRLTGRRVRRRAAARGVGVAYGVALLAVARFVLLRGSGSSILELTATVLAAGHVAYGLALGWLTARTGG